MILYFQKDNRILSSTSNEFTTHHFTWGEGSIDRITRITNYAAELIIRIFTDNPELYISFGGCCKDQDLYYENKNILKSITEKQELALTKLNIIDISKDDPHNSAIRIRDSALLESINNLNEDTSEYKYKMVRIINNWEDRLLLMRTVHYYYSYSEEVTY